MSLLLVLKFGLEALSFQHVFCSLYQSEVGVGEYQHHFDQEC